MPRTNAVAERLDGLTQAVRTAVRTAEVDLGRDYAGWKAVVRLNPPARVFDDFRSGDEEKLDASLKEIVISWNFPDDKGDPLPLPRDGVNWAETPWDLKRALVDAYRDAMMARLEVPKEISTPSEPGEQNGT